MNQRDESTDELISAYLDGELTQDERARAERLLQTSPAHQQALREMQFVRSAMQTLPRYGLDEEVSARMLVAARQTQLSRRVRLDGTSRDGPTRHETPNRWRRWCLGVSVVAAAAAALLIAFFLDSPRDDAGDGPDTGSVASVDQGRMDDSGDDPVGARPEQPRAPLDASGKGAAKHGKQSETSPAPPKPAPEMTAQSAPPDVPSSKSAFQEMTPDVEPPELASSGTAADSVPSNVDTSPDPESNGPSGGSHPQIELGPGQLSRELLLVIEAKITPSGWKTGAFERVLNEAGVAFDANLSVDPALESALLESRFFEPSSELEDRPSDEPPSPPTIVYVEAPAGALDRAWRRMKRDQSHFARLSLNMALRSEDVSIFDQLRQSSVQGTTASQDSEQNPKGRARRLELPPSWNGVPTDEASNPTELANSAGQGSDTRLPEAFGDDRGQPNLPAPFDASNDLLGGNVRVEAMFVLQGASPRTD
ncbi:MAG: zf-HC2 domain-containing protein [Planctomycetota bacterium]